MNNNILRPLPKGYNSVTYQDQFELRYLRWDYLIKTENPTDETLKSKEAIVKYCSLRAYKKYISEFNYMSMDLNDIKNIARVYVVEYLGLYSSKKNENVRKRHKKKLEDKGKNISEKEMLIKDNYALIYFVEQRLSECAHVFRQKSKHQAGYTDINLYFRKHGDSWPSDEDLCEDPSKYGWAKVTWSFLSKIKKNIPFLYPGLAFELDGKVCRVAVNLNRFYNRHSDFEKDNNISFELYKTKSPEDILIELEEEGVQTVYDKDRVYAISLRDKIENLITLFNKRPNNIKIRILNKAISYLKRRNKNGKFKKELIFLRKYLFKIKG